MKFYLITSVENKDNQNEYKTEAYHGVLAGWYLQKKSDGKNAFLVNVEEITQEEYAAIKKATK